MDKRLERIFEHARLDRVSGATEIVTMVCEGLLRAVNSRSPPSKRDLGIFLVGLVRAQPNMGPIWRLSNDLLSSNMGTKELRGILRAAIAHHKTAPDKVGRLASKMLAGQTVVTNSYSRAVLSALVRADRIDRPLVRIPESRPAREGLLLAKELLLRGIPVELYSDASLGLATVDADIAAVGADAVTPTSVIAKVGLSHLLLSARENGLRTVVMADSSKFVPISLAYDPRNPKEVLSPIPKGLRVVNRYFERASIANVDVFVTESRLLRAKDVSPVIRAVMTAPALSETTRA